MLMGLPVQLVLIALPVARSWISSRAFDQSSPRKSLQVELSKKSLDWLLGRVLEWAPLSKEFTLGLLFGDIGEFYTKPTLLRKY